MEVYPKIFGAILTLIPGIAIVGFVLKIFAVKNISEVTGRKKIFTKYLWGHTRDTCHHCCNVELLGKHVQSRRDGYSMMSFGAISIGTILAAGLMILGVWFMKQSHDMIAEETGVGMFHTVALLYFVGAILMIVMIGMLLILIAAILEIVAFFSLPDEVPGRGEASLAI